MNPPPTLETRGKSDQRKSGEEEITAGRGQAPGLEFASLHFLSGQRVGAVSSSAVTSWWLGRQKGPTVVARS